MKVAYRFFALLLLTTGILAAAVPASANIGNIGFSGTMPVAGAQVAVNPDYQAIYWWGPNGTVKTGIDVDPVPGAFIRVVQKDYYIRGVGAPDKTLFTYDITNLGWMPPTGQNGLSGFNILDITPFSYMYLASPIDPVTKNQWLMDDITGVSPSWDATFGLSQLPPPLPSNPDTYGLFANGDPGRPQGAANEGLFAYSVDGIVGIGDVAASMYSWRYDPNLGIGTPVDNLFGMVSGPRM